jgi:hypothetical protein
MDLGGKMRNAFSQRCNIAAKNVADFT